jgi:hypothetical protein
MPIFRSKWVSGAALLIAATQVLAQDAATQFARISRGDEGRPAALQTAIVTYVPRDDTSGFSVDLVAAIHLGDPRYYAELNSRFAEYDALLYELVAPSGSVVSERPSNNPGILSSAQGMLAGFLDLSFQLDEIDYGAANFVHADLSPEELRQSMVERNESLYVYFWRLYFAAMKNYSSDPYGVNDLAAIMASGMDYNLKTVFAFELASISESGDILAGDSGSALIADRNQRALEVLRQQIDLRATRVGIFYGAAHLPDMEQRLLDEFGFVHQQTVWIDAWQLGDQVQ